MQKSRLRRLTVLYMVFFAVIALSLLRTFTSRFAGEDFNTGWNDARRMVANPYPDDPRVEIMYELRTATSDVGFDTEVYSSPDGDTRINARPSTLDIEAVTSAGEGIGFGGSMIFVVLVAACYVAIFVIIFVMLGSLRRSFRRDDPFRRRSVALTRVIGALLIVSSLLISTMTWLDARAVAPYFEETGFAINTSFPYDFAQIITGVLIFVIAEIFSIGSSISEEQKLTI